LVYSVRFKNVEKLQDIPTGDGAVIPKLLSLPEQKSCRGPVIVVDSAGILSQGSCKYTKKITGYKKY
jgi:hypothetical protein